MTIWTLIRGPGDPDQPVVQVQVLDREDASRIREIGGKVFEDLGDAFEAEYNENYPSDQHGFLEPSPKGSFVKLPHTNCEIFVPEQD